MVYYMRFYFLSFVKPYGPISHYSTLLLSEIASFMKRCSSQSKHNYCLMDFKRQITSELSVKRQKWQNQPCVLILTMSSIPFAPLASSSSVLRSVIVGTIVWVEYETEKQRNQEGQPWNCVDYSVLLT